MDVSGLNREYLADMESLKKLLAEREEMHQSELNEVRKAQREQIKDINQDHTEALKYNKEKADAEYSAAKEQYKGEVDSIQDSYQRQLREQRKESYDKTGKITREASQEQQRERNKFTNQIKSITSAQENDQFVEREMRERQIKELRNDFLEKQDETRRFFESKIDKQSEGNAAALAKAANNVRDKKDYYIQEARDEVKRVKVGDEIRLQRMADENKRAMNSKDEANQRKVDQLYQKMTEDYTGASSKTTRSLEEQKRIANAELDKIRSESNTKHLLKDKEFAERLTQQNYEASARDSEKEALINKLNTSYKTKLKAETDKHEEERNRLEKQSKLNLYAAQTALQNANRESSSQMKQDYQNTLRRQQEQNASSMEAYQNTASEMLRDRQEQMAQAQSDSRKKHGQNMADLEKRSKNAHNRLAMDYQKRSDELNNLRQRELAEQKNYLSHINRMTQHEAEKFKEDTSRENQARLYAAQDLLRTSVDELHAKNENDRNHAETSYGSRMERLKKNYYDTLQSQKDTYTEQLAEQNSDQRRQMQLSRSDMKHQAHMQVLDLQTKNREMLEMYEARIANMQDEHKALLNQTKKDAENLVRANNKRTKEMIESDRKMFEYQMEIKDRQTEDKLKQQAAQFNEQIEKLKRTNALALKKS